MGRRKRSNPYGSSSQDIGSQPYAASEVGTATSWHMPSCSSRLGAIATRNGSCPLCQLEMLNGMPSCSRIRAAEDLASLGLISISKRENHQAIRVIPIIKMRKEREE
jgi:hypothetical protein